MGSEAPQARRSDAIRNRAKLLAAADAYLAEHGPPLGFNDLSAYAGVGVGTVYRHFSDPDELLDAVMEHRVDAVVALLEQAGECEDPVAGLRQAVIGICELRTRDRGIDRALTGSRASFDATRARLMPPTERIAARAQASGRMRPGFAASDIGILLWLGGTLHEYTRDVDGRLWRRYIEALLDGLQAETEPRPELSVDALDTERMAVVVHARKPPRRRAEETSAQARGQPQGARSMSTSKRPPRPHPTSDHPIAVVGATGQQGGAVARALLAQGVPTRALVRDPEGDTARALAAQGAELVPADLDDQPSLRAALTGAAALFAMASPTPERGADGETAHGQAIADAAAGVGLAHVVYSSVGGVERHTGIPHFESKHQVEQYLQELGVPTTFVRPVFFMDNFPRFMTPTVEDGSVVVRMPMPGGVPLQMIAATDVALVSVIALLQPERVTDGAVEIAGDELTGEQIAAAYGRRRGLAGRYEAVPTDGLDDDSKAMFEWFARPPAYQADFAATKSLNPHVLTFGEWLKTNEEE